MKDQFRIRSLSDKIILSFMIIGIFAIAVVSTYTAFNTKNALLDRTFDQLTSVRVAKTKQISQFFDDRINDISLIAKSNDLQLLYDELRRDKSAQFDKNEVSGFFTAKGRYLFNYIKSSGYYNGMALKLNSGEFFHVDFTRGDAVCFSEKNAACDFLEKVQHSNLEPGETRLLDYVFDEQKQKARMFLIRDITKPTEDLQLILEISLGSIDTIMLEKNMNAGLGKSGESYLVGHDQLMRSTSRFRPNSIMQTKVKTDGVEQAFLGATGTEVITDYRGISVLSSYSRLNIPGLDWVILAEIDYKEATKTITGIHNNILILTIFLAVIVFIISYIFSKRLTRPLVDLIKASDEIGKGNLDINLEKTTVDEIGELTDSFNIMAKELKHKEIELNDERLKRFSSMLDGQEKERQRLSRELHDGLGQLLIALKLKIEGVPKKDVCAINIALGEVKQNVDHTISEIRRISNDLMPSVLNEFGLATALKNVAESISENANIQVSFESTGNFEKLNNRVAVYLFRIAQEALSNTLKHANAKNCNITIHDKPDQVMLLISDDGKGFDEIIPEKKGNGLINMHERVNLLGGEIKIKSGTGQGTIIKVKIPKH